MDIFAAAQANRNRLDDDFNSLLASCPPPDPDLLQQFVDEVAANGRVAVNMRPWIAADFVQTDRYHNMYSAVAEASELSGRDPIELLREQLGTYFEKRTAFDSTFKRGKQFHYGALNIGGAGATLFGVFCFVMKADFHENTELIVYVKTDSLNGYTAADGTVNQSALLQHLAPHSHRQQLAGLKHAADVENSVGHWPTMVCSATEYVEVIFVATLQAGMVSQVRIAKRDYQELWNLCFNAHGRRLSPGERALAHAFRTMLRAAHNGMIKLCEVANA